MQGLPSAGGGSCSHASLQQFGRHFPFPSFPMVGRTRGGTSGHLVMSTGSQQPVPVSQQQSIPTPSSTKEFPGLEKQEEFFFTRSLPTYYVRAMQRVQNMVYLSKKFQSNWRGKKLCTQNLVQLNG